MLTDAQAFDRPNNMIITSRRSGHQLRSAGFLQQYLFLADAAVKVRKKKRNSFIINSHRGDIDHENRKETVSCYSEDERRAENLSRVCRLGFPPL